MHTFKPNIPSATLQQNLFSTGESSLHFTHEKLINEAKHIKIQDEKQQAILIKALEDRQYSQALRKASAYLLADWIRLILRFQTSLQINMNEASPSNDYTALDWLEEAKGDANLKSLLSKEMQAAGAKCTCLVVPLHSHQAMYLAPMQHRDEEKECIIIKLRLLQSIQNEVCHWPDLGSLEDWILMHQKVSAFIEVKPMPPFGKAAFAKTDIPENARILYSYFALARAEVLELPFSEQTYFASTGQASHVILDSKYIENKAKYLQHLPSENDVLVKRTEALTANAKIYRAQVKIHFKNKEYALPLCYIEMKAVPTHSLLGYDYSLEYWQNKDEIPTYFNAKLKSLPLYLFSYKDSIKQYSIILSSTRYTDVAEKGWNHMNSEVFIFSQKFEIPLKKYLHQAPDQSVTIPLEFFCLIHLKDGISAIKTTTNNLLRIQILKDLASSMRLLMLYPDLRPFYSGRKEMGENHYLHFDLDKLGYASYEILESLSQYICKQTGSEEFVALFHENRKEQDPIEDPAPTLRKGPTI